MKSRAARAFARLMPIGSFAAVRSISRSAMSYAHSECTDDEALHRLKKDVGSNVKAARAALTVFQRARGEFDGDRAYRLLEAVVREAPVETAPAAHRERFAREKELGWLPLDEAIAKLIELEPRLSSLWRGNAAQQRGDDSQEQAERVNGLVGPNSESADPLVRSQLALSIVHHVLATAGDGVSGAQRLSYFSAPRKRVARAGTIR
jgi:hypothetical protein